MPRRRTPGPHASARGRRRSAALALAVVIAAGLTVHAVGAGTVVGDISGDALYAVAAFAAAVLVAPRAGTLLIAALAAAWCVSVELLQLTGIPLALGSWFRPFALMLGAGFDARDLAVYVCAIAVAAAIDASVRRRLAARRR